MDDMSAMTINATVTWKDVYGNFNSWFQLTKDNRRSRVIARMERRNLHLDADMSTLVITHH